MVSPNASSHAHEWRVPEDDSAYIYEDGAVYVTETCRYVEQRSAGHSERLDETFYETLYECESERLHRFDITEVAVVYPETDDSERRVQVLERVENVFELVDRMDESFVTELEADAREALCGGEHPEVIDWFSHDDLDTGEHTVEVCHDGTRYRLTYTRTEVDEI